MISVIVPVYNGEKFIGSFIDNFLQQTHEDFELIIINDGSNDTSLDILIEKEKTDSRIRVFSFENHGVSWTRNYGMSQIKGDCFTFIDCDDLVDNNYLDILNNYLKDDTDAVFCQVKVVDENMKISKHLSINDGIYCFKEMLYKILDFKNVSTGPVAKLFKTKLIKENIKFPNYKIYEDLLFNFDLLTQSKDKKVYFTNETSYYYVHRENVGAMSSFEKSPTTDVINVIDKIINEIKNSDKSDYLFNRLVSQVMIYAIKCNKEKDKEFIKETQIFLKKHKIDLIKNKSMNRNEKILYFIYMISFDLFKKVR